MSEFAGYLAPLRNLDLLDQGRSVIPHPASELFDEYPSEEAFQGSTDQDILDTLIDTNPNHQPEVVAFREFAHGAVKKALAMLPENIALAMIEVDGLDDHSESSFEKVAAEQPVEKDKKPTSAAAIGSRYYRGVKILRKELYSKDDLVEED